MFVPRQMIGRSLDSACVLNFSSSFVARFLLVPLLSVWVAGGCVLGCGGMTALAANEQTGGTSAGSNQAAPVVTSGHACSSGVKSTLSASPDSVSGRNNHSCCKQSSSEAKTQTRPADPRIGTSVEVGSSSSGMMKDCPLAGGKVAIVTKSSRGDETNPQLAVTQSYRPEQKSVEQPTPLSKPPLLPNRGHTYLRCCVFLI